MIDLNTLSDHDLQQTKYKAQGHVYSRRGTMGELAQSRSIVKACNVILRQRGLLKDAKGQQLSKDRTGFVKAAIAPLKAAAMDHAEEQAVAYVERIALQFVGQDLNVVAPRPTSKMSRVEYRRLQARRSAILQVLRGVSSPSCMPGQPIMLTRDPAHEAAFIRNERVAAGVSFDAYVAKLEGKVGQGVTGASVEGRYLWQGSTLTVLKGDVTERWHTQQIINYSVLGNAYNQWPTRLLKG